MKSSRTLLTSLIGAASGAIWAGLIEGSYQTYIRSFKYLTLPFSGMLYYLMLGIILGFVLFGLLYIFRSLTIHRFNSKSIFSLTAGLSFIIIESRFLYHWIELKTATLPTVISIIISTAFLLLTAIFVILASRQLYGILLSIFKRPLVAITAINILLLAAGGVVAKYSISNRYVNEPFAHNGDNSRPAPDIMLIVIDALRYDYTSPYGADIKTPAIQSLADDGIVFQNLIANSFWTRPTMASMFSSLLPIDHKVVLYQTKLADDVPLLSEEVGRLGHYTIGISTNPNLVDMTGFSRGFNEYYYLQGDYPNLLDPQSPGLSRFDFVNAILGALSPDINEINNRTYLCGSDVTELAIERIGEHKAKKLFTYLHYMEPHYPYYEHPFNGKSIMPYEIPDAEARHNEIVNLYKGEIEHVDRQLMDLFNYLKEENIYDSTLIVLTSDHGEELFENYLWGHVMSVFEEVLRIPLIIKLPHSQQKGTVDSSLVSQIDIPSTIIKYMGAKPPVNWQGKDIFAPGYKNDYVLSQAMGIYSIRTKDLKIIRSIAQYAETMMSPKLLSSIDERAIFPELCIYDLSNDPFEDNNLAGTEKGEQLFDSIATQFNHEQMMIFPDEVIRKTDKMPEELVKQLEALGYLE